MVKFRGKSLQKRPYSGILHHHKFYHILPEITSFFHRYNYIKKNKKKQSFYGLFPEKPGTKNLGFGHKKTRPRYSRDGAAKSRIQDSGKAGFPQKNTGSKFYWVLYKCLFFVYNESCFPAEVKNMGQIISQNSQNSIDALDDLYKTKADFLVVFTMKFAFYTLGCKVNQYETQAMEQILVQLGHEIGSFDEKCDGYIVNTCSVTAVADRKNRTVIRRCRRENSEAVLGVCGCYSQHAPQELKALQADVVGGSGGREEFIQMLLEAAQNRQYREKVDKALSRRSFEVLPAGGLQERTRAMLKVQDGCSNFCSYCIIPYTRGPVRSASIELVVEQAKALAQRGYREIVVTGIEIASWGRDLPGKPGLEVLLTEVCNAVPDLRVRLGSLEPRIITEEFCKAMQALPNLCDHFHLSMQSGCDTVLKAMKRKYDTARYYESVELLSRYFPGCAVTTDMIVAFPGETEEEFQQSLAFIQKCRFADMHIFPYSRRPGTLADKMPGQHPNAVKEDRSRRAIAVANKMHGAFLSSLEGSTAQVLFEESDGEFFTGHTPNYVKVYAKGEDLHNWVCSVALGKSFRDGVWGEILP